VNLFVFAGASAWDMARRRSHAAIANDDWRTRDWGFVGGLDVTLVARKWTAAQVEEFATVLLVAGAPLVVSLRVVRDGDMTSVDAIHFVPRRAAA
jgi:hypothetical protein